VVDYARQDYDSALNRYTKALALQPESVTALRNLGACLFSMERWDEGMRVYARAIQLDPAWFEQQGGGAGPTIQMSVKATALMNLHFAKLFAGLGNLDVALSYLDKAVENGLTDVTLLRDEQAFKPLAEDERFNRLLEAMAAGRARI
jgi:tetratricopeptide (TPR) repeat protein